MKSRNVLILGDYDNTNFVNMLSGIGLIPFVHRCIRDIIDELQQKEYAALIIDLRHQSIDILELILNVWTFEKQTPVVVLGRISNEVVRKSLTSQKHTTIIEECEDHVLATRIVRILMGLAENREGHCIRFV